MSLSPPIERGSDSSAAASPRQRPALHIISHDSTVPAGLDLEYDARQVPNPPRDTRALHTGLSRGVQDLLLEDERYRNIVNMAEAQIREEMGKKIENAEADDAGQIGLSVGCMCGSGHHRSVAMAEELRRRDWPEDWKVEVTHRDVTAQVRDRKSMTRDMKKGMGQDVESKKESESAGPCVVDAGH